MMETVNIRILRRVARQFGPLLDELVFVGGAITSFLLTDTAPAEIRSTVDIDVILEISSFAEYHRLEAKLRQLGFRNAIGEDQPICRWLLDSTPIDIMPTDPDILGFSNRWYSATIRTAQTLDIGDSQTIRIAAAPYFIATKLEAFKGRGGRDFLRSHDLEDIITVLDGRIEIVDEIQNCPEALQQYLRHEFKVLSENPRFIEALSGHLLPDPANQARLPRLKQTIQKIITPLAP